MGANESGLGRYGYEFGYDPTPKPKMHLKGNEIGEAVPIILVERAFQTLITIYNVKEFLEDGVFIPIDVKVKQICTTVQKKFSRDRDRVVTAYKVRDKPFMLKKDWDRVMAVVALVKEWQFKDWDRVMAIFVMGKEWQFKDWDRGMAIFVMGK